MKHDQRNVTKIFVKNIENQAEKEKRNEKNQWKCLQNVYKNIEKYCQELQYFSITQQRSLFFTHCAHTTSANVIEFLWSYKKKGKKGQKKREKKKKQQQWLSMKFAIVVRRLFKQLPHPHTCTVGKIHNCRMQKIQIQIVLDKHTFVCVCENTHKFHMPRAKN